MNKTMYGEQLLLLLVNPIFLSAITSWFLSQLVKTILACITSSIHSFSDFFQLIVWRTGGMPSSHSALVASLTTGIGVKRGITSEIFIFAFFSAIIVIRDAVGVRRSNGLQAKALNDLGTKFIQMNPSYDFKLVKEIHGHRPIEVTAGVILGVIIALLYSFLI